MANSLLQLKVDSRLKEEASSIYAKLGLDLPTAIRVFLTRSVQMRGISFAMQIPEDETSNPAIMAMKRMSNVSSESGIFDMTLEDINVEINAVRNGHV